MKKSNFKEPKAVLVFNGAKILIAIFRSIHSASQFSNNVPQSVSFACSGKYISTGGYYFRHLHPDVELEFEDLDNLNLIDYDEMCGEKRKYNSLRTMARMRREKIELNKQYKTTKKGGQDDVYSK